MKWLGHCLAADLLIFKHIASAAEEICSFDFRDFINPWTLGKLFSPAIYHGIKEKTNSDLHINFLDEHWKLCSRSRWSLQY